MSKFYDGERMLSYGKHVNIIMGHRGTGKTCYFVTRAVRRFLKTGSQTVWVRRYETHFDKDKQEKFFDVSTIPNEKLGAPWYPTDTKLEMKGRTGFCDGKPFMHCVALSRANKYKSVPFELCPDVVFDEVIIDKSQEHYLTREFDAWNEFMLTVMRLRFDTTRFFLVSNAISRANPYFVNYKIIDRGKEFSFDKSKEVLLQNFVSEEIQNEFHSSWYGHLMSGTSYYDYAVGGSFLRDNDKFIAKRPIRATYRFALIYLGHTFGVWLDGRDGRLYISGDYDPQYPVAYALTRDDHSINTYLVKNRHSFGHIRILIQMYQNGDVFFETPEIKAISEEAILYLC